VKVWQECLSLEPKIIIGARSAIFAPTSNLGLVIIDEEHDSSFKSGNKPFYDARVVAEKRAKDSAAILLSGSATPSVEAFYLAEKNQELLSLPGRFKKQEMPAIKIVDLRRELADGNRSIFSRALRQALAECVQKKEQAILLLNRRGFAKYVFCRDCGFVHFCDHCSVPLIYHASNNKMRCHHCDYQTTPLIHCLNCGSNKIKQAGLGTQKLEE
jgi:primosomal protein N' (replication factor Y) (superfamily II helicase)